MARHRRPTPGIPIEPLYDPPPMPVHAEVRPAQRADHPNGGASTVVAQTVFTDVMGDTLILDMDAATALDLSIQLAQFVQHIAHRNLH